MHGNIANHLDSDWAAGVLTVNLGALTRNYEALNSQLAPARAAAVVKADAYGLGVERVATALFNAGCRKFFVALLPEALSLRDLIDDKAQIFVLNGLLPGTEAICARSGVIPVLNSLDQIKAWSALAQTNDATLPAALQVDTGMARLGLSAHDLQRLKDDPSLLKDIRLLYLMSHLASADEPNNPQNSDQLSELRALAASFPDVGWSLSNSGGIFLGSEFHGSLARPGLALYGCSPNPDADNQISPVVRLDVRVIQTREIPQGTKVGYNGSYIAPKDLRLATIAAGYADGLPQSLSNRGAAFFGDTRLPIVGRVSMDTTILDISSLPQGTLTCGSLVELIGPHQSVEMLAADAGTIPYEILTRIGRRYRRHYR